MISYDWFVDLLLLILILYYGNIETSKRVVWKTRTHARTHTHTHTLPARSNGFKYSIFHRTIPAWNSLPASAAEDPTLVQLHFKRESSIGTRPVNWLLTPSQPFWFILYNINNQGERNTTAQIHKSKSFHSSRHCAVFGWRGFEENEVEWKLDIFLLQA